MYNMLYNIIVLYPSIVLYNCVSMTRIYVIDVTHDIISHFLSKSKIKKSKSKNQK